VLGAIAAHLMVGILPGPVPLVHHPDHQRCGNLVPATNPGETLAVGEMLTGQLFW
jgi:hypothetical protein